MPSISLKRRYNILDQLQMALIEALYSDSPETELEKIKQDFAGYDGIDQIQDDGWRLSHLLLIKLRFERLTRGNPALLELFERDPQGFTKQFKQYHKMNKANIFFPHEEANLFQDYLNQKSH